MDYLSFYKLQLEPFRNDPDERFYFESAAARRAYLRILRGVHQHKGLGVLTGSPGCGKTTLGTHLHRGLDGEGWAPRCLSIGHSECASGWLLPHVAEAFDVSKPAADAPSLLEQIHSRFIELQGENRHPVLIIDEAQLLRTCEVMEEFRGLLNLLHEGRKTLSIVLLGLHELADVLRLDEPLAQRIETRVEVDALSADEVANYVEHRLTVAGSSNLFTDGAIQMFAAYSKGVPRLVNTLADNALFESFLAEEQPVEASFVEEAAKQLGLEKGEAPSLAKVDKQPKRDKQEKADKPLKAKKSVRPDWMESLVPPAETDFGVAAEAEAEVSEALDIKEEAELETVVRKGPRLEAGDFSMGSIVRAVDHAILDVDEVEDEEEPELDLEVDDDDCGFAIVTDRQPEVAEPAAPLADAAEKQEEAEDEPGLELDFADDDLDDLQLEPTDELGCAEPEPGMETRVAEPVSPNGETFVAAEFDDDDDDEPATSQVEIPVVDEDEGDFDPSSLLEVDEELDPVDLEPPSLMLVEFDPDSSMVDDEVQKPKSKRKPEPEEEQDLDALFDEIQVPD